MGNENTVKTFNIEPTTNCNLDCNYCYADKSGGEMSIETFDNFIDTFEETNFGGIELIWLGGEPLLREDFFKQVLQKTENKDKHIPNRVQTNGTLIDKDWVDFFEKYDLNPGVSIDGPKHIHNKNRKYTDERGSFKDVMDGIQLLKERGLNPGGLAVITKDSIGEEEELYQFFKDLNINPAFNPLETNDEEKQLSQNEYFMFFRKMYDMWSEDEDVISITPLKEMARRVFGSEMRLCSFSDCSDDCISITQDGESYFCSKFNRMPEFKLGKVKENGLQDFYGKKSKIIGNGSNVEDEIAGCHYMNLLVNGNINDPAYAEAKEELFNYIKNDLEDRL